MKIALLIVAFVLSGVIAWVAAGIGEAKEESVRFVFEKGDGKLESVEYSKEEFEKVTACLDDLDNPPTKWQTRVIFFLLAMIDKFGYRSMHAFDGTGKMLVSYVKTEHYVFLTGKLFEIVGDDLVIATAKELENNLDLETVDYIRYGLKKYRRYSFRRQE